MAEISNDNSDDIGSNSQKNVGSTDQRKDGHQPSIGLINLRGKPLSKIDSSPYKE